jgi:hypothetical protein
MNDRLRLLAAYAAEHDGVVSATEAATIGVDRRVLRRAVATGDCRREGRLAWRFAGTPLSWRGQLRVGLADLGPAALVGGRSAAALLGLDGFAAGPTEFVVPRNQRGRSTRGLVHTTGPVSPIDRTDVNGLPCTAAALTVLHLAGLVGRRETANALDSAVRLRLVSPDFVQRRLAALRRSGVAGVTVVQELLSDAGVESWLERRFLALMRVAGLPRPAVQRTYRRDGKHIARVDFDFDPWPVVVEVGGRKGYLTTNERHRQDRRRNEILLERKVPLFFSYEDVTIEPGYVASTVRGALAATDRAAS